MHTQWRAVPWAALAVIVIAQAAVAQDKDSATSAPDQAKSNGNSTPKKSAAAKPKTRRYNSGSTGPADSAGSFSSSSSSSSSSSASATATVPKTELATFGAGCFWHVEDIFENQKGVLNAVSGYAGGSVAYPSYEMVHTGQTGHAEVVQVEYDPKVISYENLLNIFWRCHDPTTIDRQGPDEGPQYRSVILYHSEAQRKAALKSYEQLTKARAFRSPIVTQLVPMQAFFPAEDYHQNYYSSMRRPATRRRATAAKSKVVQRKSTNTSRPTQNSRSKGASANAGSARAAQKSAATPNDTSPAGDSSGGSTENSPPK